MNKIYQNFDKLDVSFQGSFPTHILETLEEAKLKAQEAKEPALAYLGKDEIKAHVFETGAKNNVSYIFDTGPDGEVWFVSKSQKTTNWNIFVSVSSMGLALHGYEAMKARIYWLFDSFEVKAPTIKNPDTGLPYEKPVESIRRIDFCVDFKTDTFELDYKNIVGYRVKKRKLNGTDGVAFSANENGKRIESVTIGKLPNRQVIIYNKTREVKAKPAEKTYWWAIWQINPDEFDQQIWRVEARAGKHELRENWNITTFEELERKCGDVITDILTKYRYTTPKPQDTNRARWPNAKFWDDAIAATKDALKPYSSGAIREKILRGTWEEKRNFYLNNIAGNSISFAALTGIEMTSLPQIFDDIKESVQRALEDEQEAISMYTKFRKAQDRFAFFNNQTQEV